ncbi:MAG TPA: hypothetical protein DEA08_22290, partial [Planctomycetes bacterium]|nr:hypothetical protein [Planctomycetota bacterium]
MSDRSEGFAARSAATGLSLCLGSMCALAALSAPAAADVHAVPNEQGALSGKTIVFSPGHGFMLDGSRWRYQRGITHEVREDIHTNEIFSLYLQYYLSNAGARVESVRERWFTPHEVVVDDGDPGFQVSGSWSSGTSTRPFRGAGYRYAFQAAAGGAQATWTPDLPAAGRYPVYVWYTVGGNRTTEAVYTIHHSGGVSQVRLNQQQPGGHWSFLGLFHFDAGTAGKVVLSNEGSDPSKVVIADAVRFGGGVGASGALRWRESAKAFLAHKGFSSSSGDVTVRPRYGTWLAGGDTTRWRDDFLYVALHTNASGGSGTARGLSTFSYSNGRTPAWGSAGAATYPTSPSPLTAESDRLRDLLQREVLSAVRAEFEPTWPDRRASRMNFGELRESRNMPSALIELGFHDNADDAALLRSARFRAVAARAIYKGVVRYFDPNATIVPLPPTGLRLENLGGGQVAVRWNAALDPAEPSAAPQRFKVYRSTDGRGFDDGQVVNSTQLTLSGLSAGERVYVRVAALNDGGESLPSRVGAAQVGDPSAKVLIVDGFQRDFRHVEHNVAGRYTYDYSVEHLDALGSASPGAAIDYASNAEVAAGSVQLGGYDLVDWLLGRESSVDRTFDPTEQGLVESYLKSGGALLASGTELGWDLEARGGGQRFLNEVLGVGYGSDDAGSRSVRSAPGGPFANLGTLRLHDGSAGYDPASPDALLTINGSQALLAYETGAAPLAGVGRPGQSAVFSFPLESLSDAAQRQALARETLTFLRPNGIGPSAPSGGATGSSAGGSTTGGSSASPTPTPTGSTARPSTAGPSGSAPSGGGGGGGG